MAQTPSRAQTTLRRIGIVRGNLAFLGQAALPMSTVLNRFALQYRITPNAMTRAQALKGASADDCAAALVANLQRLTTEAAFISGINRLDADVVNSHLRALAADCRDFALAQPLADPLAVGIAGALEKFLERGMGTGSFAVTSFFEVPVSLLGGFDPTFTSVNGSTLIGSDAILDVTAAIAAAATAGEGQYPSSRK